MLQVGFYLFSITITIYPTASQEFKERAKYGIFKEKSNRKSKQTNEICLLNVNLQFLTILGNKVKTECSSGLEFCILCHVY